MVRRGWVGAGLGGGGEQGLEEGVASGFGPRRGGPERWGLLAALGIPATEEKTPP